MALSGTDGRGLSAGQRERYARHLALDGVGERGQERLLGSRVLVVGAGGLGSPVSLYLAAAGVGTIGVVDGDVVDDSNLQRQIIHRTVDVGTPKVESARRAMLALNPDVTVETYRMMVDSDTIGGLIDRYDVVVDATDALEAKYLVNDACVAAGKPYVHGAVTAFRGQVMTVVPGKGPCYRCVFRDEPPAGSVPTARQVGVLGAAVGVIGSLQAVEVVKLITGAGKPLVGRMLTADLLTMAVRTVPLPGPDAGCPVCGRYVAA